jgi:hypothetical protein
VSHTPCDVSVAQSLHYDWSCLIATAILASALVGASSTAFAQQPNARPSIHLLGGFSAETGQTDAAVSFGIELRGRARGRIAPSIHASKWWLAGGCDAVVGDPYDCETSAVSADTGAALLVGRPEASLQPFLSARVGGVFYGGSLERGVWNPNPAFGVIWTVSTRIGLQAEARYLALTQFRTGSTLSAPSTRDRLFLLAGMRWTS